MVVEALSSTADLADAREKLVQSFAGLDDALLDLPDVVGRWSIRQTLAHLLGWDAWGVMAIVALERGREVAEPDDDAMNRDWLRRTRSLSGAELQRLLRASRREMLDLLAAMPDEVRSQPRYDLGGAMLSPDEFVDGFIDHDTEHASEIRAWRKARGNA
ncbi:MAG: DinB family protein [Chloroflexota bacterium]|nr:DinB family protein [Chloroflexota bacterium]MXY78304.1 DinB family protein [Chloroflexota bacterium]